MSGDRARGGTAADDARSDAASPTPSTTASSPEGTQGAASVPAPAEAGDARTAGSEGSGGPDPVLAGIVAAAALAAGAGLLGWRRGYF